MTPTELYELFRSDMVDEELPYLWSDTEVWGYMDDAYSMFARLSGGISDVSTSLTSIAITAGQARSPCSPLILKIRDAYLDSTKRKLQIKNVEDTPLVPVGDYGSISDAADHQSGEVRAMIIGEEEGSVRWVGVPTANDVVKLAVFRLPSKRIDADSADTDLDEIHYRHHRHLLHWMKHLAYSKQDAETYDKGRADESRVAFEAYCYRADAESARQRHKNRVISYGGL